MPREGDGGEIDWAAFEGIPAPSYTQVPDAILDWIGPSLSEGEYRVLLYIVRRTLGWRRYEDRISLDQIACGIVTRDGRRLDKGAGMSRSAVKRALRGLREKNLVLTHGNQDLDGGNGTNNVPSQYRG